jgi:hypothetical protein
MQDLFDDEALLQNVARLVCSTAPTEPDSKPAPDPTPMVWTLPGFSGKSRVLTTFGQMPLEALRKRDPLRTLCGTYLEVTWIDKIQLEPAFLQRHPEANPIFIPKGALGPGSPSTDMLISPAQRFKLPGLVNGSSSKTAAAMTGLSHISRQSQSGFTYYMFHCGQAASVSIDGLWCETAP